MLNKRKQTKILSQLSNMDPEDRNKLLHKVLVDDAIKREQAAIEANGSTSGGVQGIAAGVQLLGDGSKTMPIDLTDAGEEVATTEEPKITKEQIWSIWKQMSEIIFSDGERANHEFGGHV